MVVLALCAPNREIEEVNSKRINPKPTIHWRRRPLGGGGGATVVLVCRISDDIYNCHFDLLKTKLKGCAVISNGIVVIEGKISHIRRYLKSRVGNSDSLKIIWEGIVKKPSFGKFSILHSSSDVAIFKFFADHRATLYWDIAVASLVNS